MARVVGREFPSTFSASEDLTTEDDCKLGEGTAAVRLRCSVESLAVPTEDET